LQRGRGEFTAERERLPGLDLLERDASTRPRRVHRGKATIGGAFLTSNNTLQRGRGEFTAERSGAVRKKCNEVIRFNEAAASSPRKGYARRRVPHEQQHASTRPRRVHRGKVWRRPDEVQRGHPLQRGRGEFTAERIVAQSVDATGA